MLVLQVLMLDNFLNERRSWWQMINFNLSCNLILGETLIVAQSILNILAILLIHSFGVLKLRCILFAVLRNNKFGWRLFRRWELRIVCCTDSCPCSSSWWVSSNCLFSSLFIYNFIAIIFWFLGNWISEFNLASF